ncbi:MAG: Hsp20/alpha crystallin family protein [Gemmatimonadaceae bacterium]
MLTDRSLSHTAGRMMPGSQVLAELFGDRSPAAEPYWTPAIDLAERANEYVLIVELPGVEPEAVDLNIEKNVLMIRGEKRPSFSMEPARETRVFAMERDTGAFGRAVRLPEHIESEKIEASFTNGLLEIRIPKSSTAQARKIPIGRDQERSKN